MEEKRAKRAVLVTVEVASDGSTISLDDVVQAKDGTTWAKADHVTRKKVGHDFMNLPDSELADLAHYVLARLSAFQSLGEL